MALVYSDRTPQLFVNGNYVPKGLKSRKGFVHPSASLGGSFQGTNYGNYRGQLDEVRIWDVSLSEGEIRANMNRTLAGDEPNLVAYFRCDEGTGLALTDHAPGAPAVNGVLENGVGFVPSGVGFPCYYTVAIQPGWNLIANQCVNANDVGTLMPAVPAGTRLLKFNNASRTYEMFNTFNGTSWTFPSQTLGLGEGAWIYNPPPFVPFTLVFRGTVAGDALRTLGNGCFMVSRQLAAPGHYADIVAGAPRQGDAIFKLVGGSYVIQSWDDLDNAWLPVPSLTTAKVGEALWICRQTLGSPPPPPDQCAAATITPGVGAVTITWPCAGCHLEQAPALLLPSATTKWTFVPGSSPAVLPATGSTMFYQVVCP